MTPMTVQEFTKIKELPKLSDSMPFLFKNGNTVDGLTTQCAFCSKEIPSENVVGSITPTNEHSATLEAFGLCYDCCIVTPALCRLADDGTFLTKTATGWQPGRYTGNQPPGLKNRLKALFRI